MYTPLKLGVAAVSVAIVVAALYPLLTLAYEAAANPNILRLNVTLLNVSDRTATVKLAIIYSGSIPLTGFTVNVYGATIGLGNLNPHSTVERTVVLEPEALERGSHVTVSFMVAGIYPVKVVVTGVGGS